MEKRVIVTTLLVVASDLEYKALEHMDTPEGFDVVKVGVGSLLSSYNLHNYLMNKSFDRIISVGTFGSLKKELKLFTPVVFTETLSHVANLGKFNFPKGTVPGRKRGFKVDAKTANVYAKSKNLLTGLILSGDSFLEEDEKKSVLNRFPNALGVDMESVALSFIAEEFKTPFNIIRTVSDEVDGTSEDYMDNVIKATGISLEIAFDLVDTLK